jgi:hypothetical protein
MIRSQDLKNQGKNLFIKKIQEEVELSKYNICRRASFGYRRRFFY